jgi:hypothetical protein
MLGRPCVLAPRAVAPCVFDEHTTLALPARARHWTIDVVFGPI